MSENTLHWQNWGSLTWLQFRHIDLRTFMLRLIALESVFVSTSLKSIQHTNPLTYPSPETSLAPSFYCLITIKRQKPIFRYKLCLKMHQYLKWYLINGISSIDDETDIKNPTKQGRLMAVKTGFCSCYWLANQTNKCLNPRWVVPVNIFILFVFVQTKYKTTRWLV